MTPRPLRLAPGAARLIREEVALAGGREVSFLARVTRQRVIEDPRAVARGNRSAVLAVARDAPEGGVMIHNHPSGELGPSDADLGVAARIHENGLGTAIVDNRATRLYVVVEPPEPRQVEPLEGRELARMLSPDGPLAALPQYEDRPGQRDMLAFVAARFNEGGVGLVEAGTGTGKSLAYLLPAARWAARNGERVVVSTNTINLQEQLVGKDLVIARSVLGEDFRWALAKGRANYVSIRRAHLAAESAPALFPDNRSDELSALLEWLEGTEDGSRSDLPYVPSREVWEEVRSDTDACLRAKCPHFQECHYQRARRAAAAADLLMVNHALFFSDLGVRIATDNFTDAAVLPPYKRVIFDEAHHLEEAATARLGSETSRVGIFRALDRLERRGKGVLAALEAALAGESGSATAKRVRRRIGSRSRGRVDEARAALLALFGRIEPWAYGHGDGGSLRLGRPDASERGRGPEPSDDPEIAELLEGALALLGDLRLELERVAAELGEREELRSAIEGRLLDLTGLCRRLGAIDGALRLALVPDEEAPPRVRWLEARKGGPRRRANLVFATAPTEVGATLASHLFQRAETTVLTSATLAVNGGFTYIMERLGLGGQAVAGPGASSALADSASGADGPEFGPAGATADGAGLDVAEALVDSPFHYPAQSLLVIPAGLPAPRSGQGAGARHQAVAELVHSLAEVTGGGVLALFTAHGALRSVAAELRALGAEGRWPLLVQGEGHRSKLLDEFARSGSALLLGAASFWEGVDVPGWPLRAVVVDKLPFRVPTEPMTEARVELMRSRGRDAFRDLMVPEAAMRLKQGIGRLIRTRDDRGVALILDDRILAKRYGRDMLDALPPMPLLRGRWAEARGRVEDFLRSAWGRRPGAGAAD